ncbi:MAG: hypothetical protein IKP00_13570 [Victivallales bacterium]|nr:hypothetical protein [Victivallales bacterium]
MKKGIILMALSTTLLALTPGDQKAAQIKFPENLTYATSKPASYPRLFLTPPELKARREEYQAGSAQLKKFLAQRENILMPLLELDDTQLRSLIPPPGQPVVYGLGMSLDPNGTILKWAGFQNPHCVIGKDDVVYPNEQFPDDGNGWQAPDGKKCYFRARAAGFLYDWLEKQLVALADCYAITAEQRYAHIAAVLLDALAPSYAADKRGPLDYPTSSRDIKLQRGGRLNKPYYQVARGLMNYIWCFEIIMTSDEMGKPSHVNPAQSIFDNVARNILFNGGIYCLGFTLDGYQLHNGHADYLRGNASVGLMLGIPEMVDPLYDSTIGFQTMLDVSIDRDGFYVESSHMYSVHTLTLYMDLADMQEAAVRLGLPGATPIYDSPAFFNLLFRYHDRAEVGGRLPRIGDDGPDRLVSATNQRAPTADQPNIDVSLRQQLSCIWYLWSRVRDPEHKRKCAEFLRAAYGDDLEVSVLQHLLFRVSQNELESIRELPLDKNYFDSRSVLYGGKGYAILRGGTPEASHGLQLLCGGLHNHSQYECLSWIFFNKGAEWSYDPGYYNTHYRFGWTTVSVSHNQVVFNAKNSTPCGMGEVLAWQTDGSAQYVYASNPEGYAMEGATRNERFIAQADAPDRSLDYWLDISIAKGGEFRDDSFHTVMTRLDTDLEFTPLSQFALGGDRFKGQHFLPDYRLSGETDKAFYWYPDGDGYTLLTEPAKAVPTGDTTLRMRFTQAGFPLIAELKQVITVDFPGAAGREYYRTYPMKAPHTAYVPYILRRDHGPTTSVFAKVIHFADEESPNPRVKAVKSLAVSPVEEGIAAYEITLADGRRDVWFIGNRTPHSFAGLNSSALVEVWRYNADGTLLEHHASGNAATGEISSVSQKNGKLELTVNWKQEYKGKKAGLLVSYGAGRPANWAVDAMEGNTITLKASKTHIGRLHFTPVGDGRYILRPVSSFFFGRGGVLDPAYIQGRHIVNDSGKVVANALSFGEPANGLLTVVLSQAIPEGFYRISELAPGDTFRLP